MTISRRTLLSSGLTMFAASNVPFQAIADVRKAGGDAPIEYFKLEMTIDGDDAPKPITIKGNKEEIDVLAWSWGMNNYRKFSEIIISSLRKGTGGSGGEDRLTENLSLNFVEALDNAFRKAKKGKGLQEGENIVRAQLKNPKWSITIKIVIKF